MESIVTASEFTNATGRGSTIREVKEIKKDEPPNQNRVQMWDERISQKRINVGNYTQI